MAEFINVPQPAYGERYGAPVLVRFPSFHMAPRLAHFVKQDGGGHAFEGHTAQCPHCKAGGGQVVMRTKIEVHVDGRMCWLDMCNALFREVTWAMSSHGADFTTSAFKIWREGRGIGARYHIVRVETDDNPLGGGS